MVKKIIACVMLGVALFGAGFIAGWSRQNNKQSGTNYIDSSALDRVIEYQRKYIASRERELSARSASIDAREDRLRELQAIDASDRTGLSEIARLAQETIGTARKLK